MMASPPPDIPPKSDIRLVQFHVVSAGDHRPYAISPSPLRFVSFIRYLVIYLCKKRLVALWPIGQRDLYHQGPYIPAEYLAD